MSCNQSFRRALSENKVNATLCLFYIIFIYKSTKLNKKQKNNSDLLDRCRANSMSLTTADLSGYFIVFLTLFKLRN